MVEVAWLRGGLGSTIPLRCGQKPGWVYSMFVCVSLCTLCYFEESLSEHLGMVLVMLGLGFVVHELAHVPICPMNLACTIQQRIV